MRKAACSSSIYQVINWSNAFDRRVDRIVSFWFKLDIHFESLKLKSNVEKEKKKRFLLDIEKIIEESGNFLLVVNGINGRDWPFNTTIISYQNRKKKKTDWERLVSIQFQVIQEKMLI